MNEKVYLRRYKEVKIIIKKGLTSVLNVWCSSLANADQRISFYIIAQS